MPKEALVLVAAAVLEARDKPSVQLEASWSPCPDDVDQVVSFTIGTA
jgi:hypothetical protein